jgi:hypothetical protein
MSISGSSRFQQVACDLNNSFEHDGCGQPGLGEVAYKEAGGSETSSTTSPVSTLGVSTFGLSTQHLHPRDMQVGYAVDWKKHRTPRVWGRTPLKSTSTAYRPKPCHSAALPGCGLHCGPDPAFVPVPEMADRGTLDVERRCALKHTWESILRDDSHSTTLTINNLPRSVTKTQLMGLADATGFTGRYDYLYVPFDAKDGISRGHAYMNFHSHKDAEEFFQIWHGMRIRGSVVTVSVSTLQGFEASIGKWTRRKLNSMDPEVRPFIQGIA